jgi:hypothetical protein
MIVIIKEYSSKTGQGKAVDKDGHEISFNYKQLKNEKAIPVGQIAEIVNSVVSPKSGVVAILFKLFQKIRGK